MEKVRGLQKLKSIADSRPKTVRNGACQEIVLGRRRRPRPAPDPALLAGRRRRRSSRSPRDHARSAHRRPQRRHVPDAGVRPAHDGHALADPQGRPRRLPRDRRPHRGRRRARARPGHRYSASAPLPKHIDEFMFAGFLRGEPVELVQGVTVDLEVPAHAEIVLEGYIEKDEVGQEGPFGDHTGYYTPPSRSRSSTSRRSRCGATRSIRRSSWASRRRRTRGSARRPSGSSCPAIRTTLPEIVDYDLPIAGAFHNCCIVSIRKQFPGHARR